MDLIIYPCPNPDAGYVNFQMIKTPLEVFLDN